MAWPTERAKRIAKFIGPLRVKPGSTVTLRKDFDLRYKAGIANKAEGVEPLTNGIELPRAYQERLAAQNTWGVLMRLQAMDAAGKDGTIRHVMSGVNPQGVSVHGFRSPPPRSSITTSSGATHGSCPSGARSASSIARTTRRSLVVRVHQELLERQQPAEAKRAGKAFGTAATARSTTGRAPHRQRVQGGEALPQSLHGGAAEALPEADRPPGQELEVLRERREGAGVLGRLPEGVLGDALAHEHGVGSVVRDPRRPQVVRADLRRRDPRAHLDGDRPEVPPRLRGAARITRRGEAPARGGGSEGRAGRSLLLAVGRPSCPSLRSTSAL